MEVGTVVGSIWATKKVEQIQGQKLLTIELAQEDAKGEKKVIVAADVIGAGIGDEVLLCRGAAASMAAGTAPDGRGIPLDAVIIGIID